MSAAAAPGRYRIWLAVLLAGCDGAAAIDRLGHVVARSQDPVVSNVMVPALVFYAGQPLIIYYDDSVATVMAAYANGTSWTSEVIEASPADVGVSGMYLAAVTDADGGVHVVYRDAAASNIRYVTGQPGAWAAEYPVSPGEDRGAGLDIAVDLGGNPWIAYRNESIQGLEVVYKSNENWLIETVDVTGNTGFWPAIDRDLGGRMAIAYHNGTDRSVRLAEFKNAGDWEVSEVEKPEDAGVAGRWLSLAVRAGDSENLAFTFPRLLYMFENEATMTLHFAEPDSDGGWRIQDVEPLLFGGTDNCMAVAPNGNVWISYLDAAALDLKVGVLENGRWRVATVDSAGSVGYWSDCQIDGAGNFHVAYAARAEGQAEIRYRVFDDGF